MRMMPLLLLLPPLLLLDRVEVVQSLQNGAALTPPMGWLSWQRYRCSEEFNETLIRDTADALVSEGYKDAGYEYVCLDDCWQGRRDKDGHLAANPEKFPSGIKALAAYVHSKGLKLGLYTAVGKTSCKKKPALGCDFDAIPKCAQAQMDIEDFVSWDIDHLKV